MAQRALFKNIESLLALSDVLGFVKTSSVIKITDWRLFTLSLLVWIWQNIKFPGPGFRQKPRAPGQLRSWISLTGWSGSGWSFERSCFWRRHPSRWLCWPSPCWAPPSGCWCPPGLPPWSVSESRSWMTLIWPGLRRTGGWMSRSRCHHQTPPGRWGRWPSRW